METMVRILSGRASLDKLRYYVAVPLGVVLGAAIGYKASLPEAGPKAIALMVVAVAVATGFGWRAPRPTRRGPVEPVRTTEIPQEHSLDPGQNDSLCDV